MNLGVIVVVEDDMELGKAIRTALVNTTTGYDIVLTGSGVEGVNQVKKRWTPLAIVDYYLLDMDGLEVIRRIKKRSPQTKIIAMSGAARREIIEAVSGAGADYFLPKPFAIADLMFPVRDLLHISLIEQ